MGFNRMDELMEPLVALPDRFDTRLAVVLPGPKVTELSQDSNPIIQHLRGLPLCPGRSLGAHLAEWGPYRLMAPQDPEGEHRNGCWRDDTQAVHPCRRCAHSR
jgi:hypothetical protein